MRIKGTGMAQWREALFVPTYCNTSSVTDLFRLHNYSVLGLETRVRI